MGRVSKRGLATAVTIAVGVSAVSWGAEAQTNLRFSHVTNPGSI